MCLLFIMDTTNVALFKIPSLLASSRLLISSYVRQNYCTSFQPLSDRWSLILLMMLLVTCSAEIWDVRFHISTVTYTSTRHNRKYSMMWWWSITLVYIHVHYVHYYSLNMKSFMHHPHLSANMKIPRLLARKGCWSEKHMLKTTIQFL